MGALLRATMLVIVLAPSPVFSSGSLEIIITIGC